MKLKTRMKKPPLRIEKNPLTTLRRANGAWYTCFSTFRAQESMSWLWALDSRQQAALSLKHPVPDQERRIRGALWAFNLQSSLKRQGGESFWTPQKGRYLRSRAENSLQQQRTIDVLAVSRRATNVSSSATGRQHHGALLQVTTFYE